MGLALIFFWIPVLAGVLVGKALGGRFGYLAHVELKHIWVLPLSVAAQALLILAAPTPPEQGTDPMRYALPLTTGALCFWAALNRALPGMWLVLLGAGCNLAVICANGGLMPTNAEALATAAKNESIAASRAQPGIRLVNSKDVMLAPEETQLWWLSDVIVSPPLPQRKVMSVGDLVLAAGLAFLAGRATYAPLSRTPHPAHRLHPSEALLSQENDHGARSTTAPATRARHPHGADGVSV